MAEEVCLWSPAPTCWRTLEQDVWGPGRQTATYHAVFEHHAIGCGQISLYSFCTIMLLVIPAVHRSSNMPSPVSKARQLTPSFCTQFNRWRHFVVWKPSAQTNARQIMWSKATEPSSWETNTHFFFSPVLYFRQHHALEKHLLDTPKGRAFLTEAYAALYLLPGTQTGRPQPHSTPPPPCSGKRSNGAMEMARPSESWGALAPISITFLSSLKTNQRKPGWLGIN